MAAGVLSLVRVEGLTKLFGRTRALAGVDARFERGRITVVEGANGSGKTTLLSILALEARPTRGRLLFVEEDGQEHDSAGARQGLRGRIGVLAHAPMLYPELTGIENLELHASLHGLADGPARIDALTDRFGVGSYATRPVQTYSRGQLQRVALARALVADPDVLLLDEPSTGLDTSSRARLVAAVQAERDRGAVVVMVSHDAAMVDALADRRIRLERGRVAGAGS